MKKINLIIVFLILTTILTAQIKYEKLNVGIHINSTHYQGDLGTEFFDIKEIDPGISISLGYYLSPTFDITTKASWSHVGFMDKKGTYGFGNQGHSDKVGYYNPASQEGWKFYGSFWNTTLNLKTKFNNGWLIKKTATVAPFIIVGIGVTRFSSVSVTDHLSKKTYQNFTLYYGGGLNFPLSEHLNIVFEVGMYAPRTDVYDGIDKNTVTWEGAANSNDKFLQYSLGLTYNFINTKRRCHWE